MKRSSRVVVPLVLSLLAPLVACGGGDDKKDSPTSPGTPSVSYVVWTNALFGQRPSSGGDFDARMEFDGRTVSGCPPSNLAIKTCGYSVRVDGVAPGRHRIEVILTRSGSTPAGYYFTGAVGVMDGSTGANLQSRQVNLERALSVGQGITIEVEVP